MQYVTVERIWISEKVTRVPGIHLNHFSLSLGTFFCITFTYDGRTIISSRDTDPYCIHKRNNLIITAVIDITLTYERFNPLEKNHFSMSFLFCCIGIDETVKLVQTAGGTCYGYVCDLCDREDIYNKAKIINEEIGKVRLSIIQTTETHEVSFLPSHLYEVNSISCD